MASFSVGAGLWSVPIKLITSTCLRSSTTSGQLTPPLDNLSHCAVDHRIDLLYVRMLPDQISHLLLGPYFDKLARILFADVIMKTIIIPNIFLSVLELIQSCLEHFDGTIAWNNLPLNTNSKPLT